MPHPTESSVHIHIHEGVSPETAAAAVRAAQGTYAGSAQRDGQAPTATAAAEGTSSDEFAEYVRRAYVDSSGQAKPLLEFLADNPERMVSMPEVSSHLGFPTPRSLPGLLGAFGRRAKHRYNGVKPFDAHQDGDTWFLHMSQEAADVINGLR
jgi:hypothetical protein